MIKSPLHRLIILRNPLFPLSFDHSPLIFPTSLRKSTEFTRSHRSAPSVNIHQSLSAIPRRRLYRPYPQFCLPFITSSSPCCAFFGCGSQKVDSPISYRHGKLDNKNLEKSSATHKNNNRNIITTIHSRGRAGEWGWLACRHTATPSTLSTCCCCWLSPSTPGCRIVCVLVLKS